VKSKAAIILLIPSLLAACTSKQSGKGPRQRIAPLVAVAKVEGRDVPVTVTAPVDLRPLSVADVGSKTLGYLDAVLVDRGDRVKRGQLLATVRPSDLPDQLTAERAALGQIQASAALAKSNLERANQLAPNGLVSQAELQQATAAVASAEASEAAARARIEALAVRLGEMRIVSPLDGVVLARKLDPGALVGSGAASIVTVAQVDPLRVFISVNEREAQQVRLGQSAHVELDALPGRSFEGKVVRLSPAFDPTTRTLDAEVQLANPEGLLRPGMYGRGSIVLETHPNAPVVSASSVVINSRGQYAFVVEGDKVHRRDLKIGVDGGTWLEITSGLAVGEEVVSAGSEGLAEGATVRVSRGDDAPAAQGTKAASRN
jgi:membrane fusion protein (multidrug efflux system)/multidrug efflux system membrane fusion protein